MRVLALTDDPGDPSARYRLVQFAPAAARDGVAIVVVRLPRRTPERARLFGALPPHDLVVLHRVLLAAGETRQLRRAAGRLAYDVDDALPFRPTAEGAGRSSRRSARFRRLCEAADLVVAGNEWIASLARPDARAVAVVPTAVDLARYPAGPAGGDGRALVWIGQPATAPYLAAIARALGRVARERPGTRLRVIGAGDAPLVPGLEVEARTWAEATEVKDLRTADVGLAPLPDDPWTRGKCGLRLLQYLAASLPAVASPVGVQSGIVRDRETGRLAASEDEWAAALGDLLGDPEARRRLGAAGRALVEERYSVAAVWPQVRAAWTGAAEGRG